MIFARSRRSAVLLAAGLGGTFVLLAAGAGFLAAKGDPRALLPGLLGVVILAFLARVLRFLRHRTAGRLGFFRDRLVVCQGRTELQATWDRIEVATLADQTDWALSRWPEVRLTDRLTIRMRGGAAFSFRPDGFGLEPVACRDLVIRLRDTPRLCERLPEFDSRLDLVRRPLSRGDLIKQLI